MTCTYWDDGFGNNDVDSACVAVQQIFLFLFGVPAEEVDAFLIARNPY